VICYLCRMKATQKNLNALFSAFIKYLHLPLKQKKNESKSIA